MDFWVAGSRNHHTLLVTDPTDYLGREFVSVVPRSLVPESVYIALKRQGYDKIYVYNEKWNYHRGDNISELVEL